MSQKHPASSKELVIRIVIFTTAFVVIVVNVYVGWQAYQMHQHASLVEKQMPKNLPKKVEETNISSEAGEFLDLTESLALDRILHPQNGCIDTGGAARFDEKTLKALQNAKNIQTLVVGHSQFMDSCMPYITGLPLKRFDCHQTYLTDDSFRYMAQIPTLEELDLARNEFTDKAIPHLKGLKHLRILDISETQVTQAAIPVIIAIPSVCAVRWRSSALTDKHVQMLARDRNLTALELTGNRGITDDGARAISSLSNLTALFLSGTGVTDKGVQYLTALKYLNTLSLGDTSITDDALKTIAGMKNLVILDFTGCRLLSANEVSALARALPKCRIIF